MRKGVTNYRFKCVHITSSGFLEFLSFVFAKTASQFVQQMRHLKITPTERSKYLTMTLKWYISTGTFVTLTQDICVDGILVLCLSYHIFDDVS